ncbi:MAG TPA: hypothetical protein VFV92_07620, partial [Candidatus Bathyarchaeia archaeon]|nr:hypothetical protein [Candidatus Bathyarchaeia archaeon]
GNVHASLWTKGEGLQDLGTLGGLNSSISFPVKDNRGLIAGVSDTSNTDPFQEDFCTLGSGLICLGFLWQNGLMIPLPTLGGNNSGATNVNSRGQVVGAAESATQDSNCIAPQVFDFQAVIWGPHKDEIQALPPLPSDVVSLATGINEHGQVVGMSSPICGQLSLTSTSQRVVLWQNGSVIDLGSLGGIANNLPFAINDRGEVVGVSDVAGDTAQHGFLWTKDKGMQDLGLLPGDVVSNALGLNNKGQVVGGSADVNNNGSAVLWENGVITDLNTLVCDGSSLYLDYAGDISDNGEITGQAIDTNTGAIVGFLAVPSTPDEPCETDLSAGRRFALAGNIRERLRKRKDFGRFGASLINRSRFQNTGVAGSSRPGSSSPKEEE